ncbi:MAG: hypothetical protein Q7R65_01235 [bacterium]|nr:hypothetical protein [bacterium]
MSKRIKLILIIVITLVLLVALVWLFFYVTERVSIAIKFKPDVTQEQAIAITEKYNPEIQKQKHFEYDNSFFSFLYPFSQTHRIQFEIGWINAELTAERIRKENAVEVDKVYVLGSHENGKIYSAFFESLNPALKNQ